MSTKSLEICSPFTGETSCALRKRHDQNEEPTPTVRATGEDLDAACHAMTDQGWVYTKDGPNGKILFFCPQCAKYVRFREDGSLLKTSQGRVRLHPAWEDMTPDQRLREIRKQMAEGDSLSNRNMKNKGGRPRSGGGYL